MTFVTENMPLKPPLLYEDPWSVETIREAVREGNAGHILAWLYLMMQWWGPMYLVGPAMTFLDLYPRLLAPHLVGLVALWVAVAGTVSWGTWLIREKLSTRWMLKAIYVAIGGVVLAVTTAGGHWLLSTLH